MRRAAKVDANHAEIKRALERVGCTVASLHQVGGGVRNVRSLAAALGVSPSDLRPDLAQHFATVSAGGSDCQPVGNNAVNGS